MKRLPVAGTKATPAGRKRLAGKGPAMVPLSAADPTTVVTIRALKALTSQVPARGGLEMDEPIFGVINVRPGEHRTGRSPVKKPGGVDERSASDESQCS